MTTARDELERRRRLADANARRYQDEWMRDAVGTVGSDLVRTIANDFRRGPTAPSSLASSVQSESRRPSGGGTAALTVPGVNHVDAIAESFARRDRLVTQQQAAELRWIEMLLERKNPYMAKTEYNPLKRYDDEAPASHREKP